MATSNTTKSNKTEPVGGVHFEDAPGRVTRPTTDVGLTSKGQTTISGYEGPDGNLYYHPYQNDTPTGENSGADSQLSPEGQAKIQQYKAQYDAAKAAGDTAGMEAAHAAAEAIRAQMGYSGGATGNAYNKLVLGQESNPTALQKSGWGSGSGSGSGGSGGSGGSSGSGSGSGTNSALRDLLDQWYASAQSQQEGRIDYATQQAITELERALEDAQPQFKEQAESVAKDEMQALDNSALYAEMRGDKGGIGQSQYNEIQAAAAQNRLAVQQAQTKLATDTSRQIADLRAQGEFEKADALLELSQTYLAQLISIEQWAAEYNLSVDQFQASLQQWQAEYDLAMKQYESDLELSKAQLTGAFSDGTPTLSAQETLSSKLAASAEALLSYGIIPSADQLAAIGMTEKQAQQYVNAVRLEAAAAAANKTSSSSSSSKGSGTEDTEVGDGVESLFSAMYNSLDAYTYLIQQGYTSTEAENIIYGDGYQAYITKRARQTDGVNESRFRAAMNTLGTSLQQGKVNQAVSGIDSFWTELSEEQKRQVKELLSRYGYGYEE